MATLTRRSFLGMAGATAAVGALGVTAAFADEPMAAEPVEDPGPGPAVVDATEYKTRYTMYPNWEGIGWELNAEKLDHTEDADCVVVGSGLGGFMASMIVKEQMPDANVIMLEKNGYCGGSTNFAECNGPSNASTYESAISSGVSHSSGTGYIADPMLMTELSLDRGMNSAWLFEKHGVQYANIGMTFYTDGNGDGYGDGSSCIQTLEKENESVGVDIRCNNQAIALCMADDYTCTGVQVYNQDNNSYYQINCPAVVLASGGMANTMEDDGLCKYYTGQDVVDKCIGWGAGQQGDGQLMAEQTAHGIGKSMTIVGQFLNVKDFAYDSALGACVCMQASDFWVNQEGIRFLSESDGCGKIVETEGSVFSIVGQNLIDFWNAGGCNKKISGFADILVGADLTQPLEAPLPNPEGETVIVNIDLRGEIEEYADNPNVWTGNTFEELGAAIAADVPNFDAAQFLDTVNEYEGYCAAAAAAGDDADSCDEYYGKANQYLVSMGDGPYYAFRVYSAVLNTCGGIRINRDSQVVDPRYNPIAGLYAAGIATSGWDGEIYGGGTCQPVAMWCGSKAARCIIEDVLGGTVAPDWYGDDPEGYTEPSAGGMGMGGAPDGGGEGGGEGGAPDAGGEGGGEGAAPDAGGEGGEGGEPTTADILTEPGPVEEGGEGGEPSTAEIMTEPGPVIEG